MDLIPNDIIALAFLHDTEDKLLKDELHHAESSKPNKLNLMVNPKLSEELANYAAFLFGKIKQPQVLIIDTSGTRTKIICKNATNDILYHGINSFPWNKTGEQFKSVHISQVSYHVQKCQVLITLLKLKCVVQK